MKRKLFASAILVAAIASCTGTGLDNADREIRLSAGFETKAVLAPADINYDGNEILFYGFTSENATKPIAGTGGNLSDGKTASYNSSTGWTITGAPFHWVANVDHRFFGWLQYDAKNSLRTTSYFGTGFGLSDNVLSIPSKTLGISEDNMDFCYSEVVKRTAAGADYSDVHLTMKHLFASFTLAASNYTDSPVTIKDVTICGLKNTKSATVTFGENSSSVSYLATGGAMAPTSLMTGTLTLNTDERKANIIGTPSNTPKTILLWPQTEAELSAGSSDPNSFIPENLSTDPYLKVVYSIDGGADITSYAMLPCDTGNPDTSLNGWCAGVRRNMEISFADKNMTLTFNSIDWNEVEPILSYNEAIAVTGELELAATGNNCYQEGNNIFFHAGAPIFLVFKIDQPQTATWMIEKDGDFDAFEIDDISDGATGVPGDGIDVAQGIINATQVKIAITPLIAQASRDYSLSLSFNIRKNNGDVISIDDDIQRTHKYTFILLKQ